jgi:hypothetical protein
LSDGDPDNNFLSRNATFNPGGVLNGATHITIVGHYAYISCQRGLVVVNLDEPLNPRITAQIGSPTLKKPGAIAVQFRYAFVLDEDGVKVLDVTTLEQPALVSSGTVPLGDAKDIYVAREYAYIAAGAKGLVILDIQKPEQPKIDQSFTAEGQINDAQSVRIASTNASLFAYVADGKSGLRIIQLTSPESQPNFYGFSPRPVPELIATYKTRGRALALSKGLDRDRAVDESGHQVSVFGRLGSRPFTLKEQQKLYLRDGQLYTVSDEPPKSSEGSSVK